MKISDVIYREEYIFTDLSKDYEFNKICFNLKDLTEGDLLFILNERLINFNSLNKLPIAVVCKPEVMLPQNIPSIRVENPRIALSMACFRYENPVIQGTKIIGVTGTNGKTTTATLICKILSDLGHKVGFIGTGKITIGDKVISDKNYSMTTPDPPLLYSSIRCMTEDGCDAIIMEVSSHSLALDKVAPLSFDYAVFTNLSWEHIDFHHSMEEYFNAKAKLFNKSKCAVINIDDQYGQRLYNMLEGRRISVGSIQDADVSAKNVKNIGFDGTSYTYRQKNFSFKMRYHPAGVYNIYNSMLAATVCIDMGCKPCEVKKVVNSISSIPGRFEIINDKIMVIIDYAHTAEAFECILRDLHAEKSAGKLIVVFGCGGNRDKAKRPLMAKTAEKYADRIILTADNSRNESTKDIVADIIRGFDEGNYEIKEKREDAIYSAILEAKDNDIVAIIGKGPEKYNIDKDGYHPFDEREIILSALKKRSMRG